MHRILPRLFPRMLLLALLFAGAGLLAPMSPAAAQDAQARLWDASIAGDTVAIGRALADGARIDSLDTRRNPNGRRALNWAAWNNRVGAIQLLLARGASINLANRTGFTPLHHAAESGSAEAALALLAAGADPAWPNQEGQTAAAVARARGHTELADRLEAATPKPGP
jgi:hypothetical protein